VKNQKRFYLCEICGNLIGMIRDSGVAVICCGEEMTPLEANTVDASKEKHVPVVSVLEGTVTVEVGSTVHPMTEEHLIEWIYLETEKGGQRKALKAGDPPKATFALYKDNAVAAYAYCNLHGLWKTEIKS
jgi:superoxide reductase